MCEVTAGSIANLAIDRHSRSPSREKDGGRERKGTEEGGARQHNPLANVVVLKRVFRVRSVTYEAAVKGVRELRGTAGKPLDTP